MNKKLLVILSSAVVTFVVVGVFLANWNIPAPSTTVEIVIPNDRFAR